MSDEKVQDSEAGRILVELLERALQGGAEGLDLEFDSSGALEVYAVSGASGIGQVIGDKQLGWGLMRTIARTKKGRTMRLPLLGEMVTIRVGERDHFGEPAYELRFGKARPKVQRPG